MANGKRCLGSFPESVNTNNSGMLLFGIFYKNVTLVSRDLNTSAYFTQGHTLHFSPSHPSSTPALDSILNRNPTNPPSPELFGAEFPPAAPSRASLPPSFSGQALAKQPATAPVPALGKSRHGQETARRVACRVVPQPRQVPRPSRRPRAALLEPAVPLAVANPLLLSRPQDINNHNPDPPQSQ